ncbi:MAG: DUF1360 domain-containing protein [Chloroflexi bacterium]|nr:DUF1360 domain-containing protein [Chloroflexota bacterium]MBV9542868.1 DUF1360 domain-containing protein [Chloroflexota bacterium]
MSATHGNLHEATRPPRQLFNEHAETRAAKLTLMSLFLGVLATFAGRVVKREHDVMLKPFDLLMLGLTSFRIGRMIAFEGVAAPLREPFTDTRPDGSGAGQTVVASGTGVRRVVGELMSCPICLGTWVAAGLVYGLHLMPRPTRVLMAVMSTTGVAELVYSVTEVLDWNARASRRQCGQ